ncbi:MAG: NAD(P)-dependent oxidoreductase [bacterium]
MKPKVWVELNLHPVPLARLHEVADVVVTDACNHTDLPGAEVAVIGSSTVDDAFIDIAGPRLKMVVRHGIGYDKVNVPVASARGVLAANTPNGPTEGTAEHAVALLLALAKGVAKADRALHARTPWDAARTRGVELKDRTLGLIGYGRIGRRVGEICGLGFGMDVTFLDPYAPDDMVIPAYARRVTSLDALLPQVDALSLHLGFTPQTHRMIAEPQMRAMKSDAMLINCSRGEIVDEAALIRVLASGHLRGAGLDVFDPEPASPDNPLFQMDNVVATPHMASATTESSFRSSSGVVDQILQLLRGEQPTWLIDPAIWPGRANKGTIK